MDWSQLNEVSDWNDLSQMMEGGGDGGSTKKPNTDGSSGKKSAETMKTKGGAGHADKPSQNPTSDLDNVPISGWSDMKQFDDDHDPDWFEEEEKRLSAIYGGHFIKVKYTEQGRPGYFCELCLSEMNAKKSLEAHCEGMKHLKKKALWEKNKANKQDDRSSDIRKGGWSDGPMRDHSSRDRSPFRGSQDRSRSPGRPRRGRGYASPPRRSGPPRDQCVLPTGPTSLYENQWDRDGFGRSGRGGSRRGFHKEPPNRPPLREPQFGRRGSPPPRSRSPPPLSRSDRFDGRHPDDHDRRGDRFDRRHPDDHDRRSRYDDPRDEFRTPRERFDDPPRGSIEKADDSPRNHRKNSDEVTPVTIGGAPTEKLNSGITGLLLTKLASCYIKDEEDADLAMNVVGALTSALREFNARSGEKKIAELLMEVELKLSTLKALKVGLKLLNKNQTPGSSAAAAAAAAAAATPRPAYSAGATSAPAADRGPPHTPFSGEGPSRYDMPPSNSQPPSFTAQGTPYPPNYRHYSHPY